MHGARRTHQHFWTPPSPSSANGTLQFPGACETSWLYMVDTAPRLHPALFTLMRHKLHLKMAFTPLRAAGLLPPDTPCNMAPPNPPNSSQLQISLPRHYWSFCENKFETPTSLVQWKNAASSWHITGQQVPSNTFWRTLLDKTLPKDVFNTNYELGHYLIPLRPAGQKRTLCRHSRFSRFSLVFTYVSKRRNTLLSTAPKLANYSGRQFGAPLPVWVAHPPPMTKER